jgi:outer membrane protein TolC
MDSPRATLLAIILAGCTIAPKVALGAPPATPYRLAQPDSPAELLPFPDLTPSDEQVRYVADDVGDPEPLQAESIQSVPYRLPPGKSGQQANIECDAEHWLAPFLARSSERQGIDASFGDEPLRMPEGFSPWWDGQVRRSAKPSSLGIDVDGLVQSALEHSPAIRAVSTAPGIRQTVLVEESADFDWRSFLETTYDNFDDPVGNTLTTGNNDTRFTDRVWHASGGFRRKNNHGGEFELAQRLGNQENNSRFLIPNPQGTARLELSYTQPLLSGAGVPYNRSRIVLAQIDTNASVDEVVELVQDHLLHVTEAYWELYRSRARYLQRVKLMKDAVTIAQNLADREQVDALHRQVLRAQAAVARRRSEIARAWTEVRNTESQLRLLVNDPLLLQNAAGELVPRDAPSLAEVNVGMSDSLTTALSKRPDISQAIRAMRATSVRLGVARNEILPRLDLLVSTYVAGLEGDARVLSAWSSQFAEGRPGFSAGLHFEMPVGNRAARARYQRRNLEMTRAISEFQSTVESSLTEVEVAVREVQTSYREVVGKYQAMLAAANEMSYLDDRFRTLPGASDSATLLLEDLLDSQERLADEEGAFVDAQVEYSKSLVRLRKATGTLLRYDQVSRHAEGALRATDIQHVPAVSEEIGADQPGGGGDNDVPLRSAQHAAP